MTPEFVPLSDISPVALEGLLDRAFGPDRFGRTAYRVRAGALPIDDLCSAAIDASGALIGSIQAWPVELIADDGGRFPLSMVGPVAVEPDRQRDGIGQMLVNQLLNAAKNSQKQRFDKLMLIGDPEYYGRFFGFTAERTGKWRLPGPFQPRRLLARGNQVPDVAGMIGPRLIIPAQDLAGSMSNAN